MHPLRLQPLLALLREGDARPQPLARPLLVVHVDGRSPRSEYLPPAPPLFPYALLDGAEGFHLSGELRFEVGPVVVFEADGGVHL